MNLRRQTLFLWMIALIVITLFARLGFWQLDRAAEKRVMLEKSSEALSSRKPQPLSVVADMRREKDYDWVEVQGRFVDAPAVLLDNQQRDGVVGVRVYRQFLRDDGLPILVDLGWLALPPERTMPVVGRDSGRHVLTGMLLPPPGQGLRIGPLQVLADGTLLTTAIDLPSLREILELPRLAPRVLRPEPDPALGYARDFDILPNTLPPERHLGYAVQWFALALAVLITALLLTWRSYRAARQNERSLP